MLRVGLTGGIGCGKSTVADCFQELGIPIIDTDVIAHELTAPNGAALGQIRSVLGERMLRSDNTLDRDAMRQRIFTDADARRNLEAILHPLILQEVSRQLHALAETAAPYVVVVIPLLTETGKYSDLIDRVLVVDCLEEQQIARVTARSSLRPTEVEAIMAAQSGRASRLAMADDVLVNTGDLATLQAQIGPLHQQYLRTARKPL